MSSDIVERLRAYKPYQINDGEPFGPKVCGQAADEIERLRAEVAALAAIRETHAIVPRDSLPDEIDLFRIMRDAGRKNADKAKAVARVIAAAEGRE